MATTIRGFITECELYPYSKENYELMRECAELKLIDRYIENVEFIDSYGESADLSELDYGYFQESTDDYAYDAVITEAENKATVIWHKAVDWVKRMVQNFLEMLRKIARIFDRQDAQAKGILKDLKSLPLSAAEAKAIVDLLNGAMQQHEGTFKLRKNPRSSSTTQPGVKNLGIDFTGTTVPMQATAKDLIAATLSDTAVVYPVDAKSAMGPEVLADYLDSIYEHGNKNLSVSGIKGSMYGDSGDGITIGTNTVSIDRLVEKVQRLYEKIQKGTQANGKHPPKIQLEDQSAVLEALSQAIADTSKVLTAYAAYRKSALGSLSSWVKYRTSTPDYKNDLSDYNKANAEQKKAAKREKAEAAKQIKANAKQQLHDLG